MSDRLTELQPLFRDILDQPELVLERGTNASNVEGWDSLAQVNLLTAIEKRYGIRFALMEILGFENVGDMLDVLEVKLRTP